MDNAPKLTVRGPNNDDWSELHALLALPAVLSNTFDLPYMSEEAFRDKLGHPQLDQHILIAEMALPSGRKRVIGAAWLAVKPKRRRHLGELKLVIHPDYWGTEVARSLLGAACDLADSWLGLRRIQAVIFVDDRAALELYEGAGFMREAVLRLYAQRAGILSDAVMLARLTVPAEDEEGHSS